MIDKQDQMLGKQDALLDEVKDMNRKFDKVPENDIVELKNDMAEVKAALNPTAYDFHHRDTEFTEYAQRRFS